MRLLPAPLVLLAACGTDFGTDEDGDGFPSSVDCDDTSADVFPGAVESCDGIDNNCDDQIDVAATEGLTTFYADLDDDGAAGDIITVDACEAPEGFLAEATDCDDLDANAAPDLTEICDGIDNDCNDAIDEGGDDITWYADADADGFGDADATLSACSAPAGYVRIAGDCDDTAEAIHPGALETCASDADDNCDGQGDANPVDGTTYFIDLDSDGFAGDRQTIDACELPEGAFATADDCDDANRNAFPGAIEVCNGFDDDCADGIDVGAIDAPTWYADTENDSYGDPDVSIQACEQPANYVANALDCSPGTSDSTQPGTPYWIDGDTDGVGAGEPTLYCDNPGNNGFATAGGDCDDTDPSISPNAQELCDDANTDEDCDGRADDLDDDAEGGVERFLDLDDDGFGTRSVGLYCDDDDWHATEDEDCDDDDANRYPGAPTTPDGEIGACGICEQVVINQGDLIINEVSMGTADSNTGEFSQRPGFEWIEIRNNTNRPLAVCEPWELAKNDDMVTIEANQDLTIAPGGFLVFGQSMDPEVNGGAPIDYAYGIEFNFGNFNPQPLTLSINDMVIDTVPFARGGSAFYFGSAYSAQLDPAYRNAEDNDCMDYWCDGQDNYGSEDFSNFGTPGEENPTCQFLSGNSCFDGSGSA